MNSIISDFINQSTLSETTLSGYGYDLTNFLNYMKNRNTNVSEEFEIYKIVSLVDMHSYIDYLENQLLNSKKSIARKISAIKNFYKYLNKKYYINNEIINFKYSYENKKTKVDVLNDDSIKALIEYVNLNETDRNKIIVFLILFNALTMDELINLKKDDIFDDSIMIRKSAENIRILKINDAVRAILSRFISTGDSLHLLTSSNNSRLSKRSLHHILKQVFIKSGIYYDGLSGKTLRNTCIYTLQTNNELDLGKLKKFLGIKTDNQVKKYLVKESDSISLEEVNRNPFLKYIK